MNGIWKTFFIYLPFIIVLMVFYWMINEVNINYPTIKVNGEQAIHDINYKYTTTLVPFIYSFTKEGRNPNYDTKNSDILIKKVKIDEKTTIDVSKMDYDITEMYISYEDNETGEIKHIYKGSFTKDITKYLNEKGIYRIGLYCKLHKAFYYDGYVDYKFKIEVSDD